MSAILAVYNILSNDSAVTTAFNSKIYSGIAPQTISTPYVILNLISSTPNATKSEPSKLDVSRIQIDIYVDLKLGYANLIEKASIVRTALEKKQPNIYNSIEVQYVEFIDERILTEMTSAEMGNFRAILEFYVTIKR